MAIKRQIGLHYEYNDQLGKLEYVLRANVECILTKIELRLAIDELDALGFCINTIQYGTIYASKVVSGPCDILDPLYADYRFVEE